MMESNTSLVDAIYRLGSLNQGSAETLVTRFFQLLLEYDVPIDWAHASFSPQHPQLKRTVLHWTPNRSSVWGQPAVPIGLTRGPSTRRSPIKKLESRAVPHIRIRLTDARQQGRFVLTDELAKAGHSEFFGMTIETGFGNPATLCFSTMSPIGFSDEEIECIKSACNRIEPFFQKEMWASLAKTLSVTYLGQDAGRRVLSGQISRGDVTKQNAIVWFSDLRDSSRLAIETADIQFIAELNTFFEVVGNSIQPRGGQILKFIGDAVLGLFPIVDEMHEHAASHAVEAALECLEKLEEINIGRVATNRRPLRCGIGLHAGMVSYGNIGTPDRLDFTAVGATVNLASRIEALCKKQNELLLVSKAVADMCSSPLNSIGTFELDGHEGRFEIFGLPADKVFEASSAPMVIPPVLP
jgi:adenylate cyclase